MSNGVPDNYSEISAFKEQISAKSRHLRLLKHLSLMLSETEDEKAFVRQAVPFIEKTLTGKRKLVLYIEIENKPVSVIGSDIEFLKPLYARLKKEITVKDSPLVVNVKTERAGSRTGPGDIRERSRLLVAPVYVKSKPIGLLGSLLKGGPRLQVGDKDLFRHLGEILGMFFCHIHLQRKLQNAKKRLEDRCRNLQGVLSVSQSLCGPLDIHTVLEDALDTILAQEVLNIENKGGIFLLNEKTQQLELTCHRNLDDCLVEREKTIELGHCLCGRVGQLGEMIVSTDCFRDQRHETRYEGMTVHGHLNLPLKTEKQVLGVLFLYLPDGVKPTRDQIEILKAISGQLSVAIANVRLLEQVTHDPLTGLYNRKYLLDRLEEEIIRIKRTNKPLTAAILDIDHFKMVNDAHGHVAGDRVLGELAQVLRNGAREMDTVARFGGEEFIVLLPETTVQDGVVAMERLREAVENHSFLADETGQGLSLTISVGIAGLCPDCIHQKACLIEAGDAALYKAKQNGRNRVVHSDTCLCQSV